MLQVGDILELVIEDVAFGGDGVARADGFVVFIPFTLEGERVRVRIRTVKKNFTTATLEEVLVPSLHRVPPPCPHFGAPAKPLPCGGCQYQHVDYPHQLELKTAQVRETLKRIGRIANPPVEPMIPSPRPYGYRNKITMRRRGDVMGYLATDNQRLLNVPQCPLADDAVNTALAELRLRLHRDPALKGVTGEMDITLRHTGAGQISWFPDPGEDTPVVQPQTPVWLDEIVMDRHLKLPSASFFQVNPDLVPVMIRIARENFADSGCRALVDAYCGVGLFALFLADQAQTCLGIEADRVAVDAATFNAAQLDLGHCRFTAGNVADLLPGTLAQLDPGETCVLLDPPRAGCEPRVLETLLKAKPKQIIYISCNPPALARDLKKLLAAPDMKEGNLSPGDGSYKLKRVTPLDMFPQTAHCEVIAALEL